MKIMITGGTGLVGRALTAKLLHAGHQIVILSRTKQKIHGVKVSQWNLAKNWIEEGAFEGVEAIVHLAGEGIADKPWTRKRKEEIIESRVGPVEVLSKYVSENKIRIGVFVTASAIGYYGGDTFEEIMTERSKPGSDFLARCTVKWEEAADAFGKVNKCRVVKIRTGIVLSKEGGVLSKLMKPIKLGLGSPLGSGKQWISWIHIEDLTEFYYYALENSEMKEAYNAVSSNPVTNKKFTVEIASKLGKKIWLPAVPAFLLKIVLGEMSVVVLGSSFVKNRRNEKEKIFELKFENIEEALTDLI
ncbi:TIGR01777 family protein [Emticicia sp. CRIBPO]|uniref:TIGR01777 family oxidoreductase n=1 Tax=Emticicia sp. CRIBPO TaxID=2683258 RepID=UPI001411FC7F|nr:TIGR01777 family oxidoreductase [Emticicia sp. CRIBPO]NBA85379.1 TIGR01777 family protein [Emticicia sp. CRIBPO]